MSPATKAGRTKLAAFRLDTELLSGLKVIRERDGLLITFQVQEAIRAWLESKGIRVVKAERKRLAGRKRP